MTSAPHNNTILECLRGFAALAVCILHLTTVGFGPVPMHLAFVGNLGVDLFFVLSGFLIARCVLVPDIFKTGEYLQHRSRRILPAYFACLVIMLVLVDARQLFEPDFPENFLLHATLLHGWSEPFYQRINGPFWTLSHEWCFYLFMALAAPLLRGQKASWFVVAGMIAAAVTARSLLYAGAITLPTGFQHPVCFLDRFAFGIAAAKCALTPALFPRLQGGRPVALLLAGGALLVGWALWRYSSKAAEIPVAKLQDMEGVRVFFRLVQKSRSLSVFQPLALSAGFAAILLAFWMKPEPLARILRRTPLPWMGKVSYSTYLWHLPIILGLLRASKSQPNSWLASPWPALGGILGLVYLMSWISYRGFEAPWFKRRLK